MEGVVTAQLIVHDIGRAGDPTATSTSTHLDAWWALHSLRAQYGKENVRGDDRSGTVGSMTGEVFQASKVWTIREVK